MAPPPPPFMRPLHALANDIESLAAASLCHRNQLGILAELCRQGITDLAAEVDRGDLDDRVLAKVKVLEAILGDAHEAAAEAARRHFLRTLWTRADPAATIAQLFETTLEDLQALELCLAVKPDTLRNRDSVARALDQGEMQHLMLGATRDHVQLERILQLDDTRHTPLVLASAMAKQVDQTTDPIQQRFLRRAVDTLAKHHGVEPVKDEWYISSFELDIGERFSGGGFSEVHVANWRGSVVAVKVLKEGHGRDLQANEVQVWERLRHPHVLQLFGASLIDYEPFLVMPLIKNGNMREYVKRHPDCDRDRLSYQCALGLEYLHTRVPTIIHGDLKAVNVLVDAQENALLADFGLARTADDPEPTQNLGALRWLSGERIKGGPPTAAADVYSLSMTLYEVWTNCLIPFAAMDDETIAWAVVERGQRPPRIDSIPEAVWTLMEQMWHAAPTLRPTAGKVAARLAPGARPRLAPPRSSSTAREPTLRAPPSLGRSVGTGTASGSGSAPAASNYFSDSTRSSQSSVGVVVPPPHLAHVHPSHAFPDYAKAVHPDAVAPPPTPAASIRPSGRGGGVSRAAKPGALDCAVETVVERDEISVSPKGSRVRLQDEARGRGRSPPPFMNHSLAAAASSASLASQTTAKPVFYGRGGAGREASLNLKSGSMFGFRKKDKKV